MTSEAHTLSWNIEQHFIISVRDITLDLASDPSNIIRKCEQPPVRSGLLYRIALPFGYHERMIGAESHLASIGNGCSVSLEALATAVAQQLVPIRPNATGVGF